MTVVNSMEFSSKCDEYLSLALNEHVYIKQGNNMFVVTNLNGEEPDEDEYVTKDELLAGIYEDIDRFYVNKGAICYQ